MTTSKTANNIISFIITITLIFFGLNIIINPENSFPFEFAIGLIFVLSVPVLVIDQIIQSAVNKKK